MISRGPEVGASVAGRLGAAHGELDPEQDLERPQVLGPLHERRPEGATDLAPVENVDLPERLGRVDHVRRRHRNPGRPELADEPEEPWDDDPEDGLDLASIARSSIVTVR